MITFQSFIEGFQPIRIAGFFSDGTVIVYINDKRYVYLTDSTHHDRWRRLAKFRPGKVLNEIKKLVRLGQATLQ